MPILLYLTLAVCGIAWYSVLKKISLISGIMGEHGEASMTPGGRIRVQNPMHHTALRVAPDPHTRLTTLAERYYRTHATPLPLGCPTHGVKLPEEGSTWEGLSRVDQLRLLDDARSRISELLALDGMQMADRPEPAAEERRIGPDERRLETPRRKGTRRPHAKEIKDDAR
jgi:hypothetical protein